MIVVRLESYGYISMDRLFIVRMEKPMKMDDLCLIGILGEV